MAQSPRELISSLSSIFCRSAAAFLFVLILESPIASAATFTGRRVSDVLDQLRSEGLTFIYNTDLVADTLLVTTEPEATSGLALATQILQACGLALSQVAPDTYAVIRSPIAVTRAAPSSSLALPAQDRVAEVVVETSRYTVASDLDGSHTFLDQKQLTNLPRLGDETLQAVQRLPGAAVNGFSSIGPFRGGVANETVILLDGLRLYEPFHLKNYQSPVSLLDSRLIGGMDVYFGGFPVTYGDRMSAVIDARSIRPAQQRYYELGLSLFHTNALGFGSFDDDRTQLLMSARRSNLSELAQLAENDFGRPDYSDAFVRLDHQFSETTRASLSTLLSHDEVTAIRASGTEQGRNESSNVYSWLTVDHTWSERLSTRAIASYTSIRDTREGTIDDPSRRTGSVSDDQAFSVLGLRIDSTWRTDHAMHRFGVEARQLGADYDYASQVHFDRDFPFSGAPARDSSRAVVLHPDGYAASGYWDSRIDLDRRWKIDGGLCVDTQTYDGSGDSAQWSPRISVLYAASDHTRLRASWGRFYQAQGIDELQVEDGVDRFYRPQHANHTIVSLEHSFPSSLNARVELYRKDYRTVMPRYENLFDPLVLLPELEYDRVRIDADSALAEGVELALNWRPDGPWSGWFSYAWSRGFDRIEGNDVYRSWDQRHAVSLGLAWTKGQWSVTIADTFHSGWPTTLLETAPPSSDASVVVGPRNAARYDYFNSLDLRATRTFDLARGQLDVFFEVTNSLSRENPCCSTYELQQSAATSVLVRRTDNWLPLVPSIGVLWRYGRQ